MLQKQYQICVTVLPLRKRLQPLARKYDRNPIRFCKRLMGKNWFKPPKEIPPNKAAAMVDRGPRLIEALAAPDSMTDADARSFLKMMNTFAARTPGRRRSELYAQALELRQKRPPLSFHQICLRLVPTYSNMSPAERRMKREQMRSGVARLLKSIPKR